MSQPAKPFSAFEWMIAFRYLKPRRQQGFVTVIAGFSMLGIAFGVAALIVVMSVMNGFGSELLNRILGLNGHMVVQSLTAQGLPDYDAMTKRIRMVPGVTSAAPIIEGQVIASTDAVSLGALVRGLKKEDLESFKEVSSKLTEGALDAYGEGDSVILGARLASSLGLAPGMDVTLIAPRGAVTPFGVTPQIKTYRVAGTFNIGMSEYDRTFIFMPLAEAQLFFNMGDNASGIEIMVSDPADVAKWRQPVQQAAGPYVAVTDWQAMNSSIFGALTVERNVMFIILALIIVVAAFNIISGLIILVRAKNGDIAILRTMGASKGAIMRIFFIMGAFIGLLGTLAGFLIGVWLSANLEPIRQFITRVTGQELFNPEIYFLNKIPSQIQTGDVIAVVSIALGLSFLATLYPSWRASRLDPVEALRYE